MSHPGLLCGSPCSRDLLKRVWGPSEPAGSRTSAVPFSDSNRRDVLRIGHSSGHGGQAGVGMAGWVATGAGWNPLSGLSGPQGCLG